MHPAVPVVLLFSFAGCISLQVLKSTVADVTAAQGAIVEGINGLDAVCQARAADAPQLAECRIPRDKARAGLRRQLESLSALGGAR